MRLVRGAVALCVCVGAVGCGDQVLLGGVVDAGLDGAPVSTSDAGVDATPSEPRTDAGAADETAESVPEAGFDATEDQTMPEASADAATDPVAPEASGDAGEDQTVAETGTGDATVDQTTGDDGGDAGSGGDAEAGQDAATEGGTFTIAAGKVCTADGWCWEHPLPQGNWLQSVWGTASDDVWAVGPVGTLLHFDGQAWSGTILGPVDQYTPLDGGSVAITSWELKGVGGSAGNDVWAVGSNRALHFDGTAWSSVPTGETSVVLNGVGSAGPSNAWAVGSTPDTGVVLHCDGSAWSRVAIGINLASIVFQGVFVQNSSDVWVCGRTNAPAIGTGVVLHYDGTSWRISESTATVTMGIWGAYSGPYNGHVWTVGQNETTSTATAEHFDGGSWSKSSIMFNSDLTSVSGSSNPLDVWAVGYDGIWHTTDGDHWSNVPLTLGNTLTGIWMGGSTLGWAVGASGAMRYFDGISWTPQNILATQLFGVWGAATDDVWLVGGAGGWVNGPAGTGALLHWDGAGVSLTDMPASSIEGVWGSGSSDVWVVGQGGYIGHRTTSLAAVQSPTTANLHFVSGTGANDVWAVGDAATILHKDASGWSTSAAPTGTTANLNGVFATSASDAWAVGDSGTVLRWNGTQWNAVSVPDTRTIRTVWAASGSDVWLGGDSGVLHWDGSGWTRPASFPAANSVFALTGSSSTDVWAAGYSAWHWDGSAWTPSNPGYSSVYFQYGIGAWTSGGESWIVGADGLAVHRVGVPRADAGTADAGASTGRCAAPGSDLFVDPVYGSDALGIGSQSLSNGTAAADCAFRTVTRALQALPSTPSPGTRIVILGPSTVLAASETFPIVLPVNTVLASQGGPVTFEVPGVPPPCPQTNGNGGPAAFCLAHPGSGIQGGSGATITIGHATPNYDGHDDGVEVYQGSDDSTFLENVTLQNFCANGVTIYDDTARLTIRQGVSAVGNLTNGLAVATGHVTIDVPAGQATTSFSGNSHYGIWGGGNIEIHGAPGSVPGTGTVIVHDNHNNIDCSHLAPTYTGPYAGVFVPSNARISGGVVQYGTNTTTIDGLVSYGNSDGIRTEGAANLKLRNSVMLDPVGVYILPTTVSGPDGGVNVGDMSRIDLGTTNALPEGGIDYGRNVFLPPDGGPNFLGTGICVSLDPDSGTLNAAGNIFSGRDCSGTGAGRLSVSSSCQGDLGIWTYLDGGFADGPTDDAGGFAGNYINAANCTQ
jgi:hypothetical protein